MNSVHAPHIIPQRARKLIVIAAIALGLIVQPLWINAAHTTGQSSHATPNYSVPARNASQVDVTPNLTCGGIVAPC